MAIDGRTHYEGCWAERGHHDCAERRIAALEAQLTRIKEWCDNCKIAEAARKDRTAAKRMRASVVRKLAARSAAPGKVREDGN